MAPAVRHPNSRRRGAFGAAAIAAISLVTAGARADPTPASLVVTRDEGSAGCPDAQAVAEQVRAIAGRDIISAGLALDAAMSIRVELVRDNDGYRALIQTRGQRSGSRMIFDVGPGCGNLSDAVAVALTVLLDPQVESTSEPLPLPPPPLPPPPAPPAPTAPVAPVPQVAGEQQRVRVGLEVSGGAAVSILERAVPMLGAGFRIRPSERFVLVVGGDATFSSSVASANQRVNLDLAYGELRGCVLALGGGKGPALDLCLQPMIGSLHGSGDGFDRDFDQRLLWLAIGAGAEARGALVADLSWAVQALAVAPLLHQTFTVERDGEARPAFVTPDLGVLVAFVLFHGS